VKGSIIIIMFMRIVLLYCSAVVAGLLASSQVLRPATSVQVFLGVPVSKGIC
jgi:hypothetical protein